MKIDEDPLENYVSSVLYMEIMY